MIGDEDVALPLASIRHLTFATSLNFAGAAQNPTNFLQSFPLVDIVALQTGYFPGPLTARVYTSLVTPFLATLRRLTLGTERLDPGDPPAEQARSAQLLLWHALLPTCTSLEQLGLPYHPCDDTRGLLACLPPISSPPTFDAPLLVQIDVYPPLFIRVDHFRSRTHTLDALLRDVLAQSPPKWSHGGQAVGQQRRGVLHRRLRRGGRKTRCRVASHRGGLRRKGCRARVRVGAAQLPRRVPDRLWRHWLLRASEVGQEWGKGWGRAPPTLVIVSPLISTRLSPHPPPLSNTFIPFTSPSESTPNPPRRVGRAPSVFNALFPSPLPSPPLMFPPAS